MIWPFRKRWPPTTSLELGESWSIGTGGSDERPMLVRFNAAARRVAGHPDYRWHASVAVPLHDPTERGLPTHDESVQLTMIEDQLNRHLCADNRCLLVGVITTGGMREFVLYTCDAAQLEERFHGLQHEVETHDLQLVVQPDQQWTTYRQFMAAL